MRHEKAVLLLALARALAGSAEGFTLDEMAAFAGCNRRTAERMRDALRELFPALEELPDGAQKRFRIPAGLDGFMQAPTADELSELHNAASALEAAGGTARAALIRSLAMKITAALRHAARVRLAPDLDALMRAESHALQAGPRPMADETVLSAVRGALKSGSALMFLYAPDEQHPRIVCPWGLLYGRAYYLVGPEAGHERPVLWRLDRVLQPELGGAGWPAPPDWSIGDFAVRSFGVFQEQPEDVVLRFSADAAPDATRFLFHPTQVLEPQPDGTLLVRFTAGGMQEMCNHLFGWGSDVTILSPPALREALATRLHKALAHHAASD